MIIRFGLAFDGLRPRLPENPVDDVVLGPAGLLGVLESQLGLPPVSAQPGEALLAYRTCLEEADAAAVAPRFYHRSLAVDPVGVARALLAWREQWYEAGWGGTFADGAPARLADLAAVEQLAMDRVPRGRGQRLQQVAAALVERSTQIERIELHDEPDDLPATWHTVLRHLEVRSAPGMELVPRAKVGTDLRRIQLRLLELYRQDEGVAGKREALQGDGSFVVVRGISRDLSAQAVGEHLRKGEQLGETVLIAERDGIILDNALERVGLPRCGFQHYTRSRGVTEVMRLGLALIWAPVDPHRLLQFLVHPVGPLPRRVRGRLAEEVAARPGVGGAAWRAALDEIAVRQRESGASEAQATALRAEIDYWLAGPRYSPEEGAPLDVLMERTRHCVEWIGRRLRTVEGQAEQTLFAAALRQGEALADGLTGSVAKFSLNGELCAIAGARGWRMNDFKGRHFEGVVVLWAVRWYCRYPISYRDLETMMTERGVAVDHSTIYRWVQHYAPEMEKRLRWQWRRAGSGSWRVDETYVKVRGKWTYLYRAVDKYGDTIDFYLSATRNTKAAKRFLGKALKGWKDWELPEVLNTDKAPTYAGAIAELKAEGKCPQETRHRQVKYLNNVVEADHGKLKLLIRPVRGFKTLKTAYATIKGFEVMRALRKGQARVFALQEGIVGEARIVERAFGVGPCALSEAIVWLQDRLASAET